MQRSTFNFQRPTLNGGREGNFSLGLVGVIAVLSFWGGSFGCAQDGGTRPAGGAAKQNGERTGPARPGSVGGSNGFTEWGCSEGERAPLRVAAKRLGDRGWGHGSWFDGLTTLRASRLNKTRLGRVGEF